MAKTSSDLPHNLMCFVNDPVSEQIVLNVIKELNMAYAETKQGTTNDIIEFLKNARTPKILIVDISDSELPLSDIARIRECCTPNLNLLVIGSRNDVGLFRDFMHIGVFDYLVKPLNNLILINSINAINTGNKMFVEKTGKLIHVISSCGGAGATTVAVNTAWILANHYFKRAVVMDLDFLFGTANLMLDIKAENSYLDILESPDKIDDYFVETILRKHDNRLYYLGGLTDLVRGTETNLESFNALIRLVKRQFNYVIVDAPCDVAGINRISMNNADIFIIMIEMSLASAQNAARLLDFLEADQPGKKILIAANKVGLSSAGALSIEAFEKVINRKINYVMPLDENTALAAANIGQPLAASENSLSDAIENIANDILGKNDVVSIEKTIIEKKGVTIDTVKNKIMNILKNAGLIK